MTDTLIPDTATPATEIQTFSAFDTYASHLHALQEVNPGLFLGYLLWYTVPESVKMPFEAYTAAALTAEAPVQVKQPPKAADVFLRACTAIEGNYRRLPTDQPGVYRNYLIRKAGSDSDWICKQVVMELVDGENHQLDFTIMGDVRFHKRMFKIEQTGSPDADDVFASIVEAIESYYKDNETILTAYTIRESYRRALEGPMQALSVRTAGGVYFVNHAKHVELSGLEKLAAAIPNLSMHVLPLIDDGNQRAMLKAAFEDDSVGELQKLMGEMAELIEQKGKVTTKQLTQFQARYAELRERTKSYSDLLDDSLETAAASLTLTKEAIKNLFSKVEDKS